MSTRLLEWERDEMVNPRRCLRVTPGTQSGLNERELLFPLLPLSSAGVTSSVKWDCEPCLDGCLRTN